MKILSFFFSFFICSTVLLAQVTIGSPINPVPGSLLDLKETESLNANATKGLLMPRVNLKALDTLEPCLSGSITNDDKSSHTGLVVYNLTEDYIKDLCEGLYVWSGNNWERIDTDCVCDYYTLGSYEFYCRDFEGTFTEGKDICSSIVPRTNPTNKFMLLTYFQSGMLLNPSFFPAGSYWISDQPQSEGKEMVITMNYDNGNINQLIEAQPITNRNIIRCVRQITP